MHNVSVVSDLSQSEREAMSAAFGAWFHQAVKSCDGADFSAGWLAHREWSRSPGAVERAARAIFEDDEKALKRRRPTFPSDSWDDLDGPSKDPYRSNAIAALTAASEKEK